MADTNNSYDMQYLQQEAIRRAREMQARAQSAAAPPAPAPAPPKVPGSVPVRRTQEPPHSQPEQPPRPAGNSPLDGLKANLPGPVGDIFDSLMADSERTLILILLLILMEEKADTGVIMALMYLVL